MFVRFKTITPLAIDVQEITMRLFTTQRQLQLLTLQIAVP